MKLTETPTTVTWPSTNYVFIEKVGPFMETAPAAWQELHQHASEIGSQRKISGFMSLYKIEPQMIYRAGVVVDQRPESLPEGFSFLSFPGGKYAKFTLTGPYSNLPEACGRVFDIVKKTGMKLRDDFYIENYVNDPRVTPEDQLITEILIPTL